MCLSWVCLAFGTAADDLTAAKRGEATGGPTDCATRLPPFLPGADCLLFVSERQICVRAKQLAALVFEMMGRLTKMR